MISTLLSIILPTFGIIGVGYLSRRIKIWNKSSVDVLNNYAYYIALPALIFQSLVGANLRSTFNLTDAFFIVIVVGLHIAIILFASGILFLLKKRINHQTRAVFPMLITFGSTAYLGIPFATYAFGAEGTVYASLLSVALVTILLFIHISILNKFTTLKVDHNVLKSMFELPFLWAVLVGVSWPVFNLPELPIFVSRFLDTLAGSAGPTALLGLGTFLYDLNPKDIPWRSAFIASFLKVTVPSVLIFVILSSLGFHGIRLVVGTAMAATSSAVTCFILSEKYKLGERLTAGTILLSVFFSLAGLSLLSYLWLGTTLFA